MSPAAQAFEPDISMWDAWTPQQAATLLEGIEVPWYVAAGWAIDLFLGGPRREHEDLEIAVPNVRFPELAEALTDYEMFVVTAPGEVTPLAVAGATHETHQTWVREPATGHWRLDVFREPSDGDTWICRRDARIRLPYARVVERTADGIPYCRPEVALLFKAKHSHVQKNEDDLAAVLPVLGTERRGWLADALAMVHPGHPWLRLLEAGRM
jgi:Aminoglycoside-2''-adenylyltransferase